MRKTIHKGRTQQWKKYTADLESKLETEESNPDKNKSILESRGLFDIQNSITGRSREKTTVGQINCLLDYLKMEILVVQSNKDRENREKKNPRHVDTWN